MLNLLYLFLVSLCFCVICLFCSLSFSRPFLVFLCHITRIPYILISFCLYFARLTLLLGPRFIEVLVFSLQFLKVQQQLFGIYTPVHMILVLLFSPKSLVKFSLLISLIFIRFVFGSCLFFYWCLLF